MIFIKIDFKENEALLRYKGIRGGLKNKLNKIFLRGVFCALSLRLFVFLLAYYWGCARGFG
jgi:hypothetical protein